MLYAPVAAATWDVERAAAPYIAGSAVLELAYLTLLAAAYRRADLSVVYPIARGGAPVLVLVAGAVALGVTTTLAERRDRGRAAGAGPSGAVTVARIAGAVFVAAGSACWP